MLLLVLNSLAGLAFSELSVLFVVDPLKYSILVNFLSNLFGDIDLDLFVKEFLFMGLEV